MDWNKLLPSVSRTNRDFPCMAPLNNMVLDPFGKVKMCCNQADVPLGLYPEQTLKEIWFGQARKNIVGEFGKQETPAVCVRCLSNGAFNFSPTAKTQTSKSFRRNRFSDYPQQLDLALSNHCNLKCAMCSWDSSHQFMEVPAQQQLLVDYDDRFLTEIKPFLKNASYIVFSGGEPFLIPIYYQLWEMLDTLNPHASIYIQTNASIYNDKVEKIITKKKVQLGLSIDTLNKETFQKIRMGATFEKVFENIQQFQEASYKTGNPLTFTITPMTLNIQEVPDLFEFCQRQRILIGLSILEHPAPLAVWTLSGKTLSEIVAGFDKILLQESGHHDHLTTWNQSVIKHYKALLLQYLQHKQKNEDQQKRHITQINQDAEGAYQRLTEAIQHEQTSGIANTPEVIKDVANIMDEVASQKDMPTLNSIHDFLASQFTATDLIAWHQRFGSALFKINGKKKLLELLYIYESASYNKLNRNIS